MTAGQASAYIYTLIKSNFQQNLHNIFVNCSAKVFLLNCSSIIIPTCNRGHLLCNTLRNLIGQLPTDGEIIVVDRSDEVCSELMEIVKNHSAQIHYYKIFVKGLPHARNYGLRRAIGETIIFCDNDVIPGHNFIENHLQNLSI